MKSAIRSTVLTSAIALAGMFATAAQAQFQTRAHIAGSGAANVYAGLTAVGDGTFYGLSAGGGVEGFGTLFRFDSRNDSIALVAEMAYTTRTPVAAPVIRSGSVYGTSIEGFDGGSIFKVDATGQLSVVRELSLADGFLPTGLIAGPNGNLYGATSAAGERRGGTFFRLDQNDGFTKLADFRTGEGTNPAARPLLVGNDLISVKYGLDFQAKYSAQFVGFDIDTGQFRSSEGRSEGVRLPYPFFGSFSIFKGSDEWIYGTISYTNFIFRFQRRPSPDSTAFNYDLLQPVFTFNGANGSHPVGTPVFDGIDTFYGITEAGGAFGLGTVYSYKLGVGHKLLHSFDGSNGAIPQGDLTLVNGVLFGTTLSGGRGNAGTIFSLRVSGAEVPEPATWALMIAGFGLVGAAARRPTRPAATAAHRSSTGIDAASTC